MVDTNSISNLTGKLLTLHLLENPKRVKKLVSAPKDSTCNLCVCVCVCESERDRERELKSP